MKVETRPPSIASHRHYRSLITIDRDAVRHNTRVLLRVLAGSELWAVVKANGYGHGAATVAAAALNAGATGLCVATVAEGLAMRRRFRHPRILVLGPTANGEDVRAAREATLELTSTDGEIPNGIRVHLKLDTGMGRWGLSELPTPPAEVVGLMSHLASADSDPAFTNAQIERFREATGPYPHLTRHIANSAAALRFPEARFDAARCGIALYGCSPFGTDPAEDNLRPAMNWTSHVAAVRLLQPGQGTGYGQRFTVGRPTWIGMVPVGYADGFRRDFTGTQVRVGEDLRYVVGTVSMDAFAVELAGEVPVGTPVTLIGPDVPAETHARVAGTITDEIVTGISTPSTRAHVMAV